MDCQPDRQREITLFPVGDPKMMANIRIDGLTVDL